MSVSVFSAWLKGALLRSYNQHCCPCPSFGSMLSLIFLLLCDGVLGFQPLLLSPQGLDLGPVLRTGKKESWPHPRINEIFFLKMLPKTWINQKRILFFFFVNNSKPGPDDFSPKNKRARNGQLYNQHFVFVVKKWTKSSYFEEEKLNFPYLHHRLLHAASI